MTISSIGSSANHYSQAVQQRSGASAVQKMSKEPENDGDKDDAVKSSKAAQPTVNSSGQTVGSSINVTA